METTTYKEFEKTVYQMGTYSVTENETLEIEPTFFVILEYNHSKNIYLGEYKKITFTDYKVNGYYKYGTNHTTD